MGHAARGHMVMDTWSWTHEIDRPAWFDMAYIGLEGFMVRGQRLQFPFLHPAVYGSSMVPHCFLSLLTWYCSSP